MARVIFGWLLVILLYMLFHHSLVHQWEQPVLIYPEADNTFWLLHLLNIPQSIMQSASASWIFDILLLMSILLFIIFPDKIIFSFLSVICLWLFHIMYSSANGHHYHHIGYLIIPLAFLFRERKFILGWEMVRYWILFLFVCSALYKFYYGGFFQSDNMSLILREEYFPLDTTRSHITGYLILHPGTAQWLYRAAAFLQLFCIVGFFTKRMDGLILISLLLFNIFNFYLLNFPFWENSLVIAPFVPWHRMWRRP
jgi:hypothetical protein